MAPGKSNGHVTDDGKNPLIVLSDVKFSVIIFMP